MTSEQALKLNVQNLRKKVPLADLQEIHKSWLRQVAEAAKIPPSYPPVGRYWPHQSEREMARRRRQLAALAAHD